MVERLFHLVIFYHWSLCTQWRWNPSQQSRGESWTVVEGVATV